MRFDVCMVTNSGILLTFTMRLIYFCCQFVVIVIFLLMVNNTQSLRIIKAMYLINYFLELLIILAICYVNYFWARAHCLGCGADVLEMDKQFDELLC